jgi:hypothetical protein
MNLHHAADWPRRHPKRWRSAAPRILLVVLLTGGSARAEADLSELDGRWKLDWDRSESFEPVMKALEVPWLMRKVAGVASVYVILQADAIECDGCPPTVRITEESPFATNAFVAVLDGEPRAGKDPAGNETLDRYVAVGGSGIELIRTRMLGSGRAARIRELRTPGADPDTMHSVLTVWVDEDEQASVRRVFERVSN